MAVHTCTDCGLVHDHVVPQTNPDVEIARINAESAFKIASLQSRADKHVAEVQAEADVDVAEAQADAIVEALAVEEEPAEEAAVDAPPAPMAIIQDTDVEPESEVAPPPEHEEGAEHESKPRKSKGLGLW
jgi:hypothetical protein